MKHCLLLCKIDTVYGTNEQNSNCYIKLVAKISVGGIGFLVNKIIKDKVVEYNPLQ